MAKTKSKVERINILNLPIRFFIQSLTNFTVKGYKDKEIKRVKNIRSVRLSGIYKYCQFRQRDRADKKPERRLKWQALRYGYIISIGRF